MNNNPMRTGNRHMFNSGPRHFGGGMGGGRFSQRFASGPSRGRSPAAGLVAAVRSAAASGGADPERFAIQAKPGRAHALPGFV